MCRKIHVYILDKITGVMEQQWSGLLKSGCQSSSRNLPECQPADASDFSVRETSLRLSLAFLSVLQMSGRLEKILCLKKKLKYINIGITRSWDDRQYKFSSVFPSTFWTVFFTVIMTQSLKNKLRSLVLCVLDFQVLFIIKCCVYFPISTTMGKL